jgi:hypothetical protein
MRAAGWDHALDAVQSAVASGCTALERIGGCCAADQPMASSEPALIIGRRATIVIYQECAGDRRRPRVQLNPWEQQLRRSVVLLGGSLVCHMAMEERETYKLIGSDKVEGTAVYGAGDEKIGSIERVMIDKVSGQVSYAVLSFGGFLGMGHDHYPIPWRSLKYDTNLGGYRTGITQSQLEKAPKYSNDNAWNWEDRARTRAVNDYYGVAGI